MKAVLLVGGMGTRLRPLTYRIPKPLVPVMGKPLMMHVIDSVPKEVDEIIIPVGYKKDAMEDYLVKNPPRRKITLIDEPEPLGTGGAVKNVENHIDGRFLVINGDSVSSLDLARFVAFHDEKKGIASISLWEVVDPTPFGVVDIDDKHRITRFQEKPTREEAFSRLINAGVYALEHDVLDYIGQGFVSMEREVFPKILERGMYGFKFDGFWTDCGKLESLLEAHWTMMGPDMESVDRSCVREGAVIRRPTVSEAGSVIAGSTIGPYAYISRNAVVGLRSTVERSIVLPDARIGSNCTIRDSIVDAGVTIPDGSEITSTIVSNARPPGPR